MLDKSKQLKKFITKEDMAAVAAANSVRFIHINTGMSRERFRKVFGEIDPETVCKLSVLGGKKPPVSPEEWQKLAGEVEKIRIRLFGNDGN